MGVSFPRRQPYRRSRFAEAAALGTFDIVKMGLLVSNGPQKTSHPFAVVPVV